MKAGVGYGGARMRATDDRICFEKVKRRILDYLAAPFGSEEWTFLNYGIEGVDRGNARGGKEPYVVSGSRGR